MESHVYRESVASDAYIIKGRKAENQWANHLFLII